MRDTLYATPSELLEGARKLIEEADAETAGLWPRTAAVLARQALESAIEEFWLRTEPAVADCSMRAQLLALDLYADPDVAAQANHAWSALSGACHHHPYQLAPGTRDLAPWTATTSRLISALS